MLGAVYSGAMRELHRVVAAGGALYFAAGSHEEVRRNLVTGAVFVAYFLWAHISLWMCAFNVKRRAWGYAAHRLSNV
jgi:hypothetical protein